MKSLYPFIAFRVYREPLIVLIPETCKEVGIRRVNYDLNHRSIVSNLLGARVYKKTRYLLLNREEEWAVVEISKKPGGRGLFRIISGVRVLSLPKNTSYVNAHEVDVGNRTSLAKLSEKHEIPVLIVRGKYEHVTFIIREKAIEIDVVDIVPPYPPHLADTAQKCNECGMLERPVKFNLLLIDLNAEAKKASTKNIMFPCNCTSTETSSGRKTLFLDRCPKLSKKDVRETTLIGCNRSAKIFRSVYGVKPLRISTCPLEILSNRRNDKPTLTRCCEAKKPFLICGGIAVTPWDSKLTDVSEAINSLLRATYPTGGSSSSLSTQSK